MIPANDSDSLRQENSRLKRLLAEKEEEILQLREALRPAEWMPPVEIGLTVQEARIVACLFKADGEVVTKERILYSLYHDKPETPEIKIVDVFVCKLRKKVADYGVEVKTAWGRGYYLDEDSLTILNGWGIDPQEAEAA